MRTNCENCKNLLVKSMKTVLISLLANPFMLPRPNRALASVSSGREEPVLVSRGRVLVLIALLSFVAAPSVARAQVLYGSVVGAVKDAQGAAIPAATIVVTNKETNLTRETVSGAEGDYTVTNVPPGHYDVKVSLTGFREFVQTNVPVSAGQISRVDVKMEIGALTETVTVASDAQLLQTDKSDLHTELKLVGKTNNLPPTQQKQTKTRKNAH